jgi:hypothetical protein
MSRFINRQSPLEQRFDIGEGSLSRRGVAFPGFELGQDGVAPVIAGFDPDPRPPSVWGCGRGIQRTASVAAGEVRIAGTARAP